MPSRNMIAANTALFTALDDYCTLNNAQAHFELGRVPQRDR